MDDAELRQYLLMLLGTLEMDKIIVLIETLESDVPNHLQLSVDAANIVAMRRDMNRRLRLRRNKKT